MSTVDSSSSADDFASQSGIILGSMHFLRAVGCLAFLLPVQYLIAHYLTQPYQVVPLLNNPIVHVGLMILAGWELLGLVLLFRTRSIRNILIIIALFAIPSYVCIDQGSQFCYNLYLAGRLEAKQYEAVVKYCNLDITRDPKDVSAYGFRAAAYVELNQVDKAIDDLTTALSVSQPSAKALIYSTRAKAYDKVGKHDLAELDRKAANELGGTSGSHQ